MLSKIYLPSSGAAEWQKLLAEPEKQWRTGFSARSLAHCWEAAEGLPVEVAKLFSESHEFGGEKPNLLLAVPEHKVPLPGGTRDSQNDLFALVICAGQTVSMTVEGKVDEPFGPTLEKWLSNVTKGKSVRLEFLQKLLGLPESLPGGLHYQLLHRTASAVIEAGRFKTDAAAMIVHSFSPKRMWFDAYVLFLELLGIPETSGKLTSIQLPNGLPLYLGWACGDQKFLST